MSEKAQPGEREGGQNGCFLQPRRQAGGWRNSVFRADSQSDYTTGKALQTRDPHDCFEEERRFDRSGICKNAAEYFVSIELQVLDHTRGQRAATLDRCEEIVRYGLGTKSVREKIGGGHCVLNG